MRNVLCPVTTNVQHSLPQQRCLYHCRPPTHLGNCCSLVLSSLLLFVVGKRPVPIAGNCCLYHPVLIDYGSFRETAVELTVKVDGGWYITSKIDTISLCSMKCCCMTLQRIHTRLSPLLSLLFTSTPSRMAAWMKSASPFFAASKVDVLVLALVLLPSAGCCCCWSSDDDMFTLCTCVFSAVSFHHQNTSLCELLCRALLLCLYPPLALAWSLLCLLLRVPLLCVCGAMACDVRPWPCARAPAGMVIPGHVPTQLPRCPLRTPRSPTNFESPKNNGWNLGGNASCP